MLHYIILDLDYNSSNINKTLTYFSLSKNQEYSFKDSR